MRVAQIGCAKNAKDAAYYEFDPYGNPVDNIGGEPYGYTFEWYGGYIQLLHLRARWYSHETGTFLSRDPVETEPSYLYVNANPINLIDPSGYQEREPNVCDDWWGPARGWCLSANNSSLGVASLLDIENFYRMLVWGNRVHFGWEIAANLLDHYLDGTAGHTPNDVPGPGIPFFIYDRNWILSTEDDRAARKTLINRFVNDHVRPVVDSCQSGPIRVHLKEPRINPPGSTEVKNSIGEHTMQVVFEAWINSDDSHFFADTTAYFFIEDKYDFDPEKSIVSGHPLSKYGVGTVPHDWLVDLAIAHWAAEFQVHVIWQEQLLISGFKNSIMFNVD